MAEKPNVFRKQVFIDKKFQSTVILEYSLLLVIGTLLFGAAAYFILNHQIGESLFSAHLALRKTGDLLLPTLLYLSLTFAVILGVAAAVITLLISHKISGPLFALARYLKLLADGRLNFEAKIRSHDQTGALADTLTEAVKATRGRVVLVKENIESLKKDLSSLSSAVDQGAEHAELFRSVNGLNERLKAIEQQLAHFQTE